MKLVLDASVGLKFVLNEPGADKARKLQAEFRNGLHGASKRVRMICQQTFRPICLLASSNA